MRYLDMLYIHFDHLYHITGSDNCTTDKESLAHAVESTYKLCCRIKSKTLSNKDFKKPSLTQ